MYQLQILYDNKLNGTESFLRSW